MNGGNGAASSVLANCSLISGLRSLLAESFSLRQDWKMLPLGNLA